MNNKTLFGLASLSLLIGIIGSLLNQQGNLLIQATYTDYAIKAAIVLFTFFHLINGTFINKNSNRKVILGFFIFFSVGAIMKILHWQGAQVFSSLSIISLLAFYSYHFYQKEQKTYTDYIKVLWAWSFLSGILFYTIFSIYTTELLWISYVLLLVLSIDWLRKNWGN